VVPTGIKDSATIVDLLKQNERKPDLLSEEIEFQKEK